MLLHSRAQERSDLRTKMSGSLLTCGIVGKFGRKVCMPEAFINGFLPQDDGTVVRIFESATFGQPGARLIWEGQPDRTGMVQFSLARSMVGQSIHLTAVGGQSKYYATTLPVSWLGVFHTVFLEHDRVLHPDSTLSVRSRDQQVTAQQKINVLYRSARYRNYATTFVFAIATVASVFVGLLIEGLPGLVTGALLTITSLVLGNYASGFSRGH